MRVNNTYGIAHVSTDTSFGGSAVILIRKLNDYEGDVISFFDLPMNIRVALEEWITP